MTPITHNLRKKVQIISNIDPLMEKVIKIWKKELENSWLIYKIKLMIFSFQIKKIC